MSPKQTRHSHWISHAVFSFLLATGLQLDAAVFTWDGGDVSDSNWTTGGNWSPDGAPTAGNTLTFGTAGAARVNNTNDFADGTSFVGITFANTSGFTLNGNAILLGSTGIDHTSGVGANTVNLAGITLTAGQTWSTTVNGLQTIASPINLNGFNLSLDTSGSGTTMTISGPISGSGNITKFSNGILTLSGTNSYVGDTTAQDPSSFTLGHIRILSTVNTTIGNFIVNVGGTSQGKLDFQNEGSLGGLASNVIKLNPTGGTAAAAWFRNLGAATLVNNVEIGGWVGLGGAETTPGNSLTASGQPLTFNGAVTLTGNARIQSLINSASSALTFNTGITETGGSRSLRIFGDNHVYAFNGNNSYSGGTLIGESPAALSGMYVTLAGDNTAASGTVRYFGGNLYLGHDNSLGTNLFIVTTPASTASGVKIGQTSGKNLVIANPMVWSNGFYYAGGPSTESLTFTGDTALSNNVTIGYDGTPGGAAALLTLANKITDNGANRSLTITMVNEVVRISGVGSTFGGGVTFVKAGAISGGLQVGSDTALGTGLFTVSSGAGVVMGLSAVSGDRTLANAISLQNQSALIVNGNLAFNGAATMTGNRTIQVNSGGSLNLAGGVGEDTGGRTLTHTGAGTLILGANGTYSGATTISAGTVIAAGNNALGTAAAGTTVASGATLGFQGDINYTTAEAVTSVSGPGAGNLGAIRNVSGDNSFAGTITLAGNTALGADAGSLVLNGNVSQSSASAVNKVGPGTVALAGTLGYSGNTTISNGALRVNANLGNLPAATIIQLRGGVIESSGAFGKTLGTGSGNFNWNTGGGGFSAFAGPLTVDVNGNATADNLTWGAGNFVPTGSPLIFGSVSANNAVTFTDNIDLGSSGSNAREIRVVENTNSTSDKAVITGVIAGTGSGNSLLKSGSGLLELRSANTYSGNTTVSGGTLLVNNSTGSGTGSGSVTINSGAGLGGTGTISGAVVVDAGGALAPGNSPGTLTVGPLTLNNTSILNYELGPHDVNGIGYVGLGSNDLTVVSGNLTLDGILNVTALDGFYAFGSGLAATNVYRLFDYSGTLINNALTLGTLPAGTTGFIQTSIAGQVNLLVIPEPTTVALLGLAAVFALRRRRR